MPAATHDRWNQLAGFLLLTFAAALPHSIAAAQVAAGLTAVTWLIGRLVRRQRPAPTPLDVSIVIFLLVTGLAAVFSLEPSLSAAKLGSAALVLIVPVTAGIITSRRQAALVVLVLLGSACLSAGVTVWEKIVGRGVDVVAVSPESPFRRRIRPRDVILSCDGQSIHSPEQFQQLLAERDSATRLACRGLRGGITPFTFKVSAARLRQPSPPDWGVTVKVGRSLRARGTYSHFVTYAEVLLQLTALACGLWLACPRKWSRTAAGLALVGLLLAAALAATYTRASWAALIVAGLAMLWMRVGWRARIAALAAALVAVGGMNAVLVHWRGVGFYNPSDLSMQYRWMMWEDAWRLVGEHPWLGIGMDTALARWQELGLRAYERFGLHSHFHSTPIQLAVERGLLGLAAWLLLMGLYVRMLVKLVGRTRNAPEWWVHGLALGVFGAAAGFLGSGLLHYNFGDSEVVMVFWLLAGVAVALDRLARPLTPAD